MGERARASVGASPRASTRRPLVARLVLALLSAPLALAVALLLVEQADSRGWLPPLPTPFDRPPHLVAVDGGPLFAIDRSAASFLAQPGGADYAMARAKAPGTFRILSLGESTTFGAGYAPAASYSRFLEERLRRQSGREVEVVNCGRSGYDSHDLPSLAAELAGFAPDLLIAYVGHNEIKRPNLLGVLDPDAARIARSRLLLRLLGVPHDRDFAPPSLQIGPCLTHEQRERARSLFGDGVRALVDAAERIGAPLLLCLPASNVLDHRPRCSIVRAGTDAERRLARVAAAGRGWEEGTLVDLTGPAAAPDAIAAAHAALREVDAALSDDPLAALLHFRRGRLLLALGERDAGLSALHRSQELDDLPERASPDLVAVLRRQDTSRSVVLVDVAARFAAASARGAPGADLFYDYCHPLLRGHWLIADELLAAIAAGGWLGSLDPAREPGGDDAARFEAWCRELGVSEQASAAQLLLQARGFANDVGTRPEIPSEADCRIVLELVDAAEQMEASAGRDLFAQVLRGLVAAARKDGASARAALSEAAAIDAAGLRAIAVALAGLPGWVAALGAVGITLRDGAFAWEGSG